MTHQKPSLFKAALQEHTAVLSTLPALEPQVTAAAQTAVQTLSRGGKILFCGNGGSASDSQHLAAELVGRFVHERRALAALALTADNAILTCVGNDYSFADIFSRQVQGLGRAGDVLVAISTSGNSQNVVRAVEAARQLGMHTIGLLGRDGGQLAGLCDQAIVVPSLTTARIQEAHILIGHVLCSLIESTMGLVPAQ